MISVSCSLQHVQCAKHRKLHAVSSAIDDMEVDVGEATSWQGLTIYLSFLRYRSLVIKKNALLTDLKSSIQANTRNLVSSSRSNYKVTHKELLPKVSPFLITSLQEIQMEQKFQLLQHNLTFFVIVNKENIFLFRNLLVL